MNPSYFGVHQGYKVLTHLHMESHRVSMDFNPPPPPSHQGGPHTESASLHRGAGTLRRGQRRGQRHVVPRGKVLRPTLGRGRPRKCILRIGKMGIPCMMFYDVYTSIFKIGIGKHHKTS
jgi:hypothetical protein